MVLKLHYFSYPGRAETARIMMTMAGIPFEDVWYEYTTWEEAKHKFPFKQVPVLEFEDGTMLAQSGAIDRYCAKRAGLLPEDPMAAALADQAALHTEDIMLMLGPTWAMGPEEALKARETMMTTGRGQEMLTALDKLLAPVEASGKYIAGDKLSWADLFVYNYLTAFVSGNIEGIPKDLYKDYPALKAFRNRIARLPAVKEYYAIETEGARAAHRPDA